MHNGVRVIRLWAPIKVSRGMLTPALPWAAYFAMRQADIVSVHTPTPEMGLVGLDCQNWQMSMSCGNPPRRFSATYWDSHESLLFKARCS